MNFLSGIKTYIGGFGLILLGIGGAITHKIPYFDAATYFSSGLAVIGARSFGQKLLDILKSFQK